MWASAVVAVLCALAPCVPVSAARPAITEIEYDAPDPALERRSQPARFEDIPVGGYVLPPGLTKDGKEKKMRIVNSPPGSGGGGATARGSGLEPSAAGIAGRIDLSDCRAGLPASEVLTDFVDTSDMSSAVVMIRVVNAAGTQFDFCSGTLIGATVVATAAHVYDTVNNRDIVGNGNRGEPFRSYRVYRMYNRGGDTNFQVATATRAPYYTQYMNNAAWNESLIQGSDVAILILNSSFSGASPMPWFDIATGSTALRATMGYPGVVQDGLRLAMDTTTDAVLRSSTRPGVMSQNLANEGGMSGGAMFWVKSPRALLSGITSGGAIDACPNYWTPVNNLYSLRGLVQAEGRVVTCTSTQCSTP